MEAGSIICKRCERIGLKCAPHVSRQGQGLRRRTRKKTRNDNGYNDSTLDEAQAITSALSSSHTLHDNNADADHNNDADIDAATERLVPHAVHDAAAAVEVVVHVADASGPCRPSGSGPRPGTGGHGSRSSGNHSRSGTGECSRPSGTVYGSLAPNNQGVFTHSSSCTDFHLARE